MSNAKWFFRRRPLKIFISYRRDDSMDSTGRLHTDLRLHFNRPFRNYLRRRVVLIRDLDSIPGGAKFREYIEGEIKTSVAVLAVIGKDWLKVTKPQTGQRRIDDPEDSLRIEIATALSLSKPVIPVLVEKAPMPDSKDLPDALSALTEMNGRDVSEPEWDAGVKRLIKDLEAIMYSPWSTVGGIALLVLLLGALSAFSIFAYQKCCGGELVTNVTPTPTATLTSSTPSPSPVSTATTPTPTVSVTPTPTPSPTATPSPSPMHPLKGRVWEYEQLDSNGRPVAVYLISFDSNDSYAFSCKNKYAFLSRCANEYYIPSPNANHERKWYLEGNTVTIYWYRGTVAEQKDVGVLNGRQMSGTGEQRGEAGYRWRATRLD